MTKVDDAYLKQCEEAAEKATPGPWEYDGMHDEITAPYNDGGEYWLIYSECRTAPNDEPEDNFGHQYSHDFAFIALSRSAVPILAAEVRRLREALGKIDAALSSLRGL